MPERSELRDKTLDMGTTLRQKPTDYFSRDQIRALRNRSNWHATWLLVHCWGVIFTTWAACALWTNPVVVAVGVLIVGTRQLGLTVLNHEGAHHLLYSNRALNDWVSEWILNRPLFGASVHGYRKSHLEHHKHTQQQGDPDLVLSAPFPITKTSFRRKVWRDLSGQTGWKQRKELVVSAFRPAGGPISVRLNRAAYRLGPNLLINMAFLAGFVAYGVWYLYFLLWLLPSMTWLLFISRLRNIGEHACVVDNDDRLRNTRTTHASWLERMFIAPYWVNYHLEHHLLVSCPCYRLRRAHRILMAGGHGTAMDLQPSYAHVIRLATATA